MTGRPRVLVAAGSETLALRLRLMLEAEGALPEMLGEGPGDWTRAILAVTVPTLAARVRMQAPGLPVLELKEGEDWGQLRTRLAAALAAAAADPAVEAHELAAALAKAHILLVDDSVTYREFLRQELSRLGAAVTVCGNADDALAHLACGGWDCVLIDLVMPGLDGAELCGRAARLRRDGGWDYVLVVLSSREGSGDLIRSLNAGADLFLGKSQDGALMRAKLGAMLRLRALRH